MKNKPHISNLTIETIIKKGYMLKIIKRKIQLVKYDKNMDNDIIFSKNIDNSNKCKHNYNYNSTKNNMYYIIP